jgi:hypothetical protein
LQVCQVDQQIRLPLCRFGYGRPEISPSATLELNSSQQLRAFPARKVLDPVNISVADDQAKQRFGLFERGLDLGGETPEKAFVNRAGSANGERDTPLRAALVATSNSRSTDSYLDNLGTPFYLHPR